MNARVMSGIVAALFAVPVDPASVPRWIAANRVDSDANPGYTSDCRFLGVARPATDVYSCTAGYPNDVTLRLEHDRDTPIYRATVLTDRLNDLAAVQDTYSRAIVGWSLADHMRAELVVDALEMAVRRRRPERGLVHHSDQGSQYVSLAFGQKARDAGIAVSMGSRGDCFDNAVAESFFATLKKELVNRHSWPTKSELGAAVFEFIEVFYNRERRHSTLGMLSPSEFEASRFALRQIDNGREEETT